MFDVLEDRCVPAVFNVDLAIDENDFNNNPGDLCLREAINLSNGNADSVNTIRFTQNASTINAVQTLTLGQINITKSVNILVDFPDSANIRISGNNASRIFDISGSSTVVTLQGVTLENGFSDNFGGGAIYVESNARLILTQCVLQSNVASFPSGAQGGALVNDGGSVTIDRCAFISNEAQAGGISGTGFGDGEGGAIFLNSNFQTSISNTTFSGNSARGSSNGSGSGGAIFHVGSAGATLTNCTISNNFAQRGNGGTGNPSVGGGIRSAAFLTLKNTIVAGNFALQDTDFSGSATSQTRNIIGSTSGNTGFGAGDLLNTNPNLSALTRLGHTFAFIPNAGSPAIDAGTNTGITSTFDQRGAAFARIANSTIDIGAFEVAPLRSFLVDEGTDVVDNNYTAGHLSLREAIAQANASPGSETISFSPALFASPRTIVLLRGDLRVTDDTTILGPGSESLTLSGGGSGGNLGCRIFTIDDGKAFVNKTVKISGLTVALGDVGTGNGGGLMNAETLTIDACSFRNNFAQFGGAIVQESTNLGILTVTNSTFSSNLARSGGGAIFSNSSQRIALTIDRSTFSNNNSNSLGGGIVLYDGGSIDGVALSISNSTVSNNRALADVGGGIVIDGAQSFGLLNNVTISGNTSNQQGAGIFFRTNRFLNLVVNCTISGNASGTNGGGIYCESNVRVTGSTITLNGADSNNNSTTETGGGIFTAAVKVTQLHGCIPVSAPAIIG